jgi:hypothetical protein
MRFDWYQATLEVPPLEVINTLSKLGHEVRRNDSAAKAYRYKQGWEVHNNDLGVVARVFHGGNGDKPHALSSSDATDSFVDLVRNEWEGRHLVTRMDSAQDFNDSTAFNRLKRISRKVAKDHRLGFPSIQDELNTLAGRTQYIGSVKSDYRARLYEKGYEQVAKATNGTRVSPGAVKTVFNTITGQDVAPGDWVRLELQARPQGEHARRLASVATPEQAWTFTSWSQHLAKDALALDLERFYIRTRKVSKDEESLRWMCQQYGGMLHRLQADLGDWACVGLEVGRIIQEQTFKR